MDLAYKRIVHGWVQSHEDDPIVPMLLSCINYQNKIRLSSTLLQMLQDGINQGLIEVNNPWHCETMARFNSIECLKLLRSNGCPWDKRTFNMIVKYGDVDAIRWCFEQDCPGDIDEVCQHAIAGDKSDNLKLLSIYKNITHEMSRRLELHSIMCDYMSNPIYIFEFGYEHNLLKLDVNFTRAAARHNRIDVLRFAIDRKCPIDRSSYEAAIEEGHLEIALFLESIDFSQDN